MFFLKWNQNDTILFKMTLLKKKETLIGNITYMGLMSAINVIFVLLTTFFPFFAIFLIFLLPLASTIVSYYCKRKYYLIYAIATILICACSTFAIDIGNTIFYVIPSLISGFIFGFLISKKCHPIRILFIAILSHVVLSYPAIKIVELIYERNIIKDFLFFLNLNDFLYSKYLVHLTIVSMAFIQQLFSLVIVYSELSKIERKLEVDESQHNINPLMIFGLIIINICFAFLLPEFSLACIPFIYLFAVYEILLIFKERKKKTIVLIILLFILSVFIYAWLNTIINKLCAKPFSFMSLNLLNLFPLFVGIIAFIKNNLLRKTIKDTIK